MQPEPQPSTPVIVRPWPEWLPLAEAAEYARMSPDKLKRLVAERKVLGYANPDFKRGPKGGGEWWIKRASIDDYHDAMSGEKAIKTALTRLGVV